MIARKHFVRGLIGSLIAAAGGCFGVRAAQGAPRHKKKDEPVSSAVPEPTPAKVPEATSRLRLWKTSDVPDVPVHVQFLPYGKQDSAAISPLEVQALSYQFASYIPIPAGPQVIEVSARDRVTVRLPLYLMADAQYTLLIRVRGTTLSAEWIDDASDPTDAGCEFSVYNLLFSSGDIQVDFGTLLSAHLSPGRSSAKLGGIKRALYSAVTSGVDGAGKSFRWTTEVDFRQYRKAALLIYPDSYGRIRPRVSSV